MGKQNRECALCGKTIVDLQESCILTEALLIQMNVCRCLKDSEVYMGINLRSFITPQEQFVSDHFWNRAIPTEQEIREIEIEKDTLVKPNTIQVIQDPVQIQNIGYEILIIYSSANALHRQEKLGTIKSLRETVEESGVKRRVLVPQGEQSAGIYNIMHDPHLLTSSR